MALCRGLFFCRGIGSEKRSCLMYAIFIGRRRRHLLRMNCSHGEEWIKSINKVFFREIYDIAEAPRVQIFLVLLFFSKIRKAIPENITTKKPINDNPGPIGYPRVKSRCLKA